MSRRVALVRTDVSEELSSSFIRVTRIGELGTTLAVTSNPRTLRRNTLFIYLSRERPPLLASGQSSRLQIQRSRVRLMALPDYLTNSGSGTGPT
jgi:hypothetical protein